MSLTLDDAEHLGRVDGQDELVPIIQARVVPGFFETLEIDLLSGACAARMLNFPRTP